MQLQVAPARLMLPGGQKAGLAQNLGLHIQLSYSVALGKLRKFPCPIFPEIKKGK